jgi:cell division septation protein DedD
MADRRMEFSLSTWQALLLLTGVATTLLLIFIFGVMVGKGDIEGLKLFDREVRSDVVKMKIESAPLDQLSDRTTYHQEKAAIMNDTTSKPIMTFYDTLAKPGKNGKEPAPSDSKIDRSSTKVYAIQLGAMNDSSLADAMVLKLKKFGYSAYIASSESSGKTWHKVRLGTFSSKEDARKEAARIEEKEGMSATVVEK